jgi:rod shape-determining protein MreC
MAPPSNRRPGFSRKAQYGLFATYVLAVAGTIFAGLLLIISIADPTGFSGLRKIGTEITAPASRFITSVQRSLSGAGGNMSAYLDAARKNASLEKRVNRQHARIIRAQAIEVENARLRKLLGLLDSETDRVAMGQLVSGSSTSSRRLATLSVGSNAGLEKSQTVVGPDGLVGRIVEVGPTTARVLLITDAENVVPVMRAIDGLPAFASGLSNGLVSIKPLDLGINPFKPGDMLVTSGNGGIYRPNTPFAVVVKKTVDGAVARPMSQPAATPYVLILKEYLPEATAAQIKNEELSHQAEKGK